MVKKVGRCFWNVWPVCNKLICRHCVKHFDKYYCKLKQIIKALKEMNVLKINRNFAFKLVTFVTIRIIKGFCFTFKMFICLIYNDKNTTDRLSMPRSLWSPQLLCKFSTIRRKHVHDYCQPKCSQLSSMEWQY